MKINIIAKDVKNSRWDLLWHVLDQGKGAGITYDVFSYIDSDRFNLEAENCDGYIYLSVIPLAKDKPFTELDTNDSDADLINKVQKFAREIKDNKKKILSRPFQSIVVDIEGNEISLTPEEIITLGELHKIIDKFGYSVKKVIV